MPSPIPIRRLLLTLLLAGGLTLTGFTVGGLLAASLLVGPADGLAGGATVTVAALGGGLVGLIVGIVLGWRLRPARLAPMAWLAVACALVAIALAVWSSSERRRARAAVSVVSAWSDSRAC